MNQSQFNSTFTVLMVDIRKLKKDIDKIHHFLKYKDTQKVKAIINSFNLDAIYLKELLKKVTNHVKAHPTEMVEHEWKQVETNILDILKEADLIIEEVQKRGD